MTKSNTVDEYISAAPQQAQEKLHEIRAILKEVAPNAKEAIKWGQPVMEEKRILFAYSALIFRCNCATCFGDVVPQKKDDFLAKFIN